MTRPILWALGTLGSAALASLAAGDHLSARLRPNPVPAASAAAPGAAILTVAADLAGHFLLHPSLDGRRVRMLVDTGASLVVLTHEDAGLAGIRVEERDFTRQVSTANGVARVAPVRLREVRVGDIVVRDVEALVSRPGQLGTSLLGMSFLRRLKGFEMGAGRLTLRG